MGSEPHAESKTTEVEQFYKRRAIFTYWTILIQFLILSATIRVVVLVPNLWWRLFNSIQIILSLLNFMNCLYELQNPGQSYLQFFIVVMII